MLFEQSGQSLSDLAQGYSSSRTTGDQSCEAKQHRHHTSMGVARLRARHFLDQLLQMPAGRATSRDLAIALAASHSLAQAVADRVQVNEPKDDACQHRFAPEPRLFVATNSRQVGQQDEQSWRVQGPSLSSELRSLGGCVILLGFTSKSRQECSLGWEELIGRIELSGQQHCTPCGRVVLRSLLTSKGLPLSKAIASMSSMFQ